MSTYRLAVSATPFIGRTEELVEIAGLLADPACRLLTLFGPGGIGKTRLALEAARQWSSPERVYLIPLQPLTSPDFIVSAIADAVGFHFYLGADPKQQLLDYLSEKQWLLVLDNIEHLLDGTSLLSEILTAAPDLKMLVTSRERLNLVEEWVLEIDGLAYPASEMDADAEYYSAVDLFVQQARRVKASFHLNDAQQPAIVRICRLVGGMPLGIELSANWVRVLSCNAIAEEIGRSLDILETPARNVEPRHRTMRAAVEPTWARLSDEERNVFMRLSLFRGGFTREAAEAVAAASLRTLSTLVDRSLLRVDANGRYDIHELLRQYGEERLNDSVEETEQVRDLHCHFYADFMSQRKDALVHGNPKLAAAEIDTELENVRSAWNTMVEGAKTELIEKALIALNGYYHIRGLYQEGASVFGKAAERFREQGDLAFVLAVSHQAWCLQYLGDFKKAVELYQQGLAGFRRLGVATQTAFCLERLSEIARAAKDYGAARQYAEEAGRVIDEIDESERWRQAFILPHFGHIAFLTGDLLDAKHWYEEALTMSQTFGVQIGMADALYYLGNVELALGAYTKAEQAYQASLKRSRDFDIDLGCINAFSGLGEAALRRKAYAEAKQYCQDGLQLAERRMLVNIPVMRILLNVSELFIEQEQYERAAALVVVSLYHPVSEESVKERAQQLLPQLEGKLQPHIFAAAWERGKKLEVSTLMAELIIELNQPALFRGQRGIPASLESPLSNRELEILRLMAGGLSNQEIADRLYIGISTVKKHINHIYDKLDVKNRTEAVARARERWILS